MPIQLLIDTYFSHEMLSQLQGMTQLASTIEVHTQQDRFHL